LAEENQELETVRSLIQPKIPAELEAAKDALHKLQNDMMEIRDDPNKVSFLMGVDTKTGVGVMVPIPTKENMEKLKENFDKLPPNIQKTIENTMPKGSKEAMQDIWKALDEAKSIEDLKKLEKRLKGQGASDK